MFVHFETISVLCILRAPHFSFARFMSHCVLFYLNCFYCALLLVCCCCWWRWLLFFPLVVGVVGGVVSSCWYCDSGSQPLCMCWTVSCAFYAEFLVANKETGSRNHFHAINIQHKRYVIYMYGVSTAVICCITAKYTKLTTSGSTAGQLQIKHEKDVSMQINIWVTLHINNTFTLSASWAPNANVRKSHSVAAVVCVIFRVFTT